MSDRELANGRPRLRKPTSECQCSSNDRNLLKQWILRTTGIAQ